MSVAFIAIPLSYSWHLTLLSLNKNNVTLHFSPHQQYRLIFAPVSNPGYSPRCRYVKHTTVYFCEEITWVNWQCLADILSITGGSSGYSWVKATTEKGHAAWCSYKPIFRSARVLPGSLSFRTHNTILTTAVCITTAVELYGTTCTLWKGIGT